MSRTPDEISQNIREKLKGTASGLSLELGTPERKIVDAVAEAVSECYIDQYIVGSLLDVEAKGGLELEQFLGIFGYGRLQGRRATGEIRLEMSVANAQDTVIAAGSAFYTKTSTPGSGNPMFYAATQSVVLPAGNTVVYVPVECTVPGTAGNLPPDTVTYMGAVIGAASATNLTEMSGGTDVETDDQMRQRFKDTFLRSVAGTEDFYLALALQNKNVSKAVVFGPITTYRTQIAAPSSSVTLSSVLETSDVKYVWDRGEAVFKNLGQSDEVFYTRGNDYSLSTGASPTFTRVNTGTIVQDAIVDLEFQYTTKSSRNLPASGITNTVDVFVNGSDPFVITERTVVSSTTFSATSSLWNWTGNFMRVGAPPAYAGPPAATSRVMRLGSAPVLAFPETMSIRNGNGSISITYTRNTHYYLVRGTTLEAGSQREVAAIEWLGNGPDTGTGVTCTYTYNRVPEVLNAVMRKQKQITTDVLVHQADYVYLKINLSVEYDRGYIVSQVNNAIEERLQAYMSGIGYGAWIEFSDLSLQVHQVRGVDNVWVTTQSEPETGYGVVLYDEAADFASGTPIAATSAFPNPKVTDFKLADNQLPVLLTPTINRRANR